MIPNALKRLFSHSAFEQPALDAYLMLVTQSRRPWFYEEQGVADTVDGRFDVTVLHLFLLIHRLRKEQGDAAAYFIRGVSEVFFADMDRSLREMGAGDTGVGIRVRKMVEAFYGRLQAYEQALGNPQALGESLKRNMFRDEDVPPEALQALRDYVLRNVAYLEEQDAAQLLQGNVTFLS